MKYWLHEILQFIFFLIAMTTLSLVYIGYAIYTLFYYLFTGWKDGTR